MGIQPEVSLPDSFLPIGFGTYQATSAAHFTRRKRPNAAHILRKASKSPNDSLNGVILIFVGPKLSIPNCLPSCVKYLSPLSSVPLFLAISDSSDVKDSLSSSRWAYCNKRRILETSGKSSAFEVSSSTSQLFIASSECPVWCPLTCIIAPLLVK